MTATERALTLAQTAAQAAADKLAKDILIIDVSDRLAITDCFVVVTGTNERQVSSIVDAVEEKMRAAGEKPVRREGERDGRWVLLDFLDVVVHVQHSEERVFYALDRLWKDCPTIPFVDADAPAGAGATTAAGVEDAQTDGIVPETDTDTDTDADGIADEVDGETEAVEAAADGEASLDPTTDDTLDVADDTLDVADEAGDLAAGGPDSGTEAAGSGR